MTEKPLSPWQPETDPLTLAILGKLSEELNELGSAVARCIIQGIDESEPVTGKPNRQWLMEEMADVRATVIMAAVHFRIDEEDVHARSLKKRDHLRRWHRMISGNTGPQALTAAQRAD